MLLPTMAGRAFGTKPLSELEADEVVVACERNYIDYWACAGARPYADYSEDGGITRAITGLPNEIFNVVLMCKLSCESVDRSIDAAIESFRDQRIPLLWHVGKLTEPRDLGKRLESRGFPHDYDLRAMAVDLKSADESLISVDGIEAEVVSNVEQSRHWIGCIASSWHLPKEVPEWMFRNPCFNMALESSSNVRLPRRMYLGLMNGKPVSASMLFWSDEIAGLQAVGTIPSAQKKGAGGVTVGAALRDARKMGFRNVVVLSTVEGVPLYENLGFRAFGLLPEHSMRFDK